MEVRWFSLHGENPQHNRGPNASLGGETSFFSETGPILNRRTENAECSAATHFLFSHAAKIDTKDAHRRRDHGAPVKVAFRAREPLHINFGCTCRRVISRGDNRPSGKTPERLGLAQRANDRCYGSTNACIVKIHPWATCMHDHLGIPCFQELKVACLEVDKSHTHEKRKFFGQPTATRIMT